MEGHCPHCHARLELPEPGIYQCERCHHRFEVALGTSAPPPHPAPTGEPATTPPGGWDAPSPAVHAPEPVVAPELQAPCAYHPANAAVGVCERCGDFMCGLCSTAVEGRTYCPRCFDLLYQRGSLQVARRHFTLPATTLTLGLSAFFGLLFTCGCLSVPLGVGGLVTGFRSLREHRERPELPGRGLTVAGITFSILGILGTVVIIALVFIGSPWSS